MFEKIVSKGPMTRRELWRSFDNPRIWWFALEALLTARKMEFAGRQRLCATNSPFADGDGSDDLAI
jgi:hypothetical protein